MSDPVVIDLNADLGEGSGHDEALLEIVTSANIACGAHAGDDDIMRRTCAAAVACGVVVGAHPGYPDREHFGRRPLNLTAAELATSLAEQYAALAAAARDSGAPVGYVKPHGALYHRSASDREIAQVIEDEALRAEGLRTGAGPLIVLGPPPTPSLTRAPSPQAAVSGEREGGTLLAPPARRVIEGFADRAYALTPSGAPTLVDRALPGAVLSHDEAVAQAVSLAITGLAVAADGTPVAVRPRSLCLHGDTPGAVALAREIRAELERAGVLLRAFAP